MLYQDKYLNLNLKVSDYLGEAFNTGGKEDITVLHCLLHNSGLAPDPDPWYWSQEFACPNSFHAYPEEDFSCMGSKIYASVFNEVVDYPPGEVYVYSDLNFMILSYIVGIIAEENKLVTYDDYSDVCKSSPYLNDKGVSIMCSFESYVR